MDKPATHYVRTADGVHVAYQVIGDGPDLIYCIGLWWHLDYQWEIPAMREQLERLSRSRRVILFDKRGTGLSDRVPEAQLTDLDARIKDLRAVLDAVGSERAAILSQSHSADLVLAFAAREPDRTEALVVIDGYATLRRSSGHPWGLTGEQIERSIARIEEHWDEPQGYGRMGNRGDALALERWMTMQRVAVSPSAAAALWRAALGSDVRGLLGQIAVPTLVIHHEENGLVDVACGRYLAEAIPNAKLRILPARREVWDAGGPELAHVEEFLNGRSVVVEPDRVLATVLFTDIVDSTAAAARAGDRAWRELLDEHDRIVERVLARHGGRKVNPTGDGMLAAFDGPARAVRCARDLRRELGALEVAIRAGIHTGEVEVRGDDLGGLAVHIGARVAGLAGAGEILVTRTLTELVAGSDLRFEDRGEHELKGVPSRWHVFANVD